MLASKRVLITNESCYSPEDAIKCYHDPIFCDKFFISGKRELKDVRPMYGEYSYLDHQQWFYVIQHGGIAFLFHPCADKSEVALLRSLANNCLHRHILAPYEMLSTEFPLALISWGCYFLTSKVNVSTMKLWIQNHSLKGPASHVLTNGRYKDNLLTHSKVLTDKQDSFPCPDSEQKHLFHTAVPKVTSKQIKRYPERIIKERLEKAEHKRDKPVVKISANFTVTEVKVRSAAWAASSLIFLCAILAFWLVYTKYWAPADSTYKYNRLHSLTDEFDYRPGHSDFSLLKSNQKFVSIFKREKKIDAASRVHLMVPINEEEEDDNI